MTPEQAVSIMTVQGHSLIRVKAVIQSERPYGGETVDLSGGTEMHIMIKRHSLCCSKGLDYLQGTLAFEGSRDIGRQNRKCQLKYF